MAEQKIKFKVSIKELSFEFEGTRDVGQALQAGLSRSIGGLLDTQRTVMALPGVADASTDDTPEGVVIPAEPPNGHQPPPPEKVKKPRKTNGVSVTNLLRELKEKKYFTEPRTSDAIRERLRIDGYTVAANRLSGRLQEMMRKKELYREDTAEGFVYKDTPFDESPRTPNPPANASE